MDSKESKEVRHAVSNGHPETDEGPYYHDSWWESYKGGIKGMFGGLFVGSGVGAAMGVVAGGALALALGATFTPATFGLLVLSFTAFGALMGAHEFSGVGVVAGAVAAAHGKSEARIKEFESAKFAELKQEIRGLKADIAQHTDGKRPKLEGPTCDEIDAKHADYRTSHGDEHCERPRRFMFLKVAAIGATTGAMFGALLGAAGMFAPFMEPVTAALSLSGGQLVGASAIVGAAAGGSFGINRDLFREIFDVTDHWFRGVIVPTLDYEKALAPQQSKERVLIEPAHEQETETYFQDKVTAEAARRALLSLDHTNAVRH